MSDTERRLAAALAEHRLCWRRAYLAVCACGDWQRRDDTQGALKAPVREWHDAHLAAALLPVVAEIEAEARACPFGGGDHRALIRQAKAEALRGAADEMDEFAAETYPEDVFRRPTSEQYAEINALLKRERGHQLDGIAADAMSRAIQVQANRLRERAAEVTDA